MKHIVVCMQEPGRTEQRQNVWDALLGWYARNGRHNLPWRQTRDPYAVLVSEFMLQQTQVDRVLPRFRQFMERFPDFGSLARASTADVIREWSGLGYNARAVRLQAIAREVVEQHHGELPATLDELVRFKGIGRYTAGALACFAFNLQVETVDTNIRRVLWRVFRGIEPADWPTRLGFQRSITDLASWALPPGRAYDWQQALMDLGATICTARAPKCETCPVGPECSAFAETSQMTLFPSGSGLADVRSRKKRVHPKVHPDTHTADKFVAEHKGPYVDSERLAPRPKRRVSTQFKGSSRYYRGRIVEALSNLPVDSTVQVETLGTTIKADFSDSDRDWLNALIQQLVRDGLVKITNRSGDTAWISLP